jgi:uncharacterized protein YbaP (TraB family)
MKIISLRFFVLLLILFLIPVASHAQKNFLWKVQSSTTTAYILGSIHFLKENVYPLSNTIEDAFDRSDVLVIEANINDMGNINLQAFMEKAFYFHGETLEKNLSEETFTLVKKKIAEHGIPLEIAGLQKPWVLALTLTSLELMQAGYNPRTGIDFHFISKAREKKKILELESLDFQIDLFSRLSDQDQELFLLYTLRNLDVIEQETDQIVRAWSSGDPDAMNAVVMKSIDRDTELSPFYEKFIYDRNRNMVSKIEEFLKTDDTYFVVVGAAHLVGDQGIIELIRERGYTIEQL